VNPRPGVESSIVTLPDDICQRVVNARDARFDGIFFVAVTTTGIYCRPVCPSRGARPQHRRFFESAASAEHAGFRPCLRCRPELAPGRAMMDAVPRLAHVAAEQIAAGALNGHTVSQLAVELGVSERHLRRAMKREMGVSPNALAQTHRLLLAKRLLIDTALPVTRVAFASGFQSLRRFNSVFRERYRLTPSALRPRSRAARLEVVRLTLAYRPPLAWDVLTSLLDRGALPGVEVLRDGRYARTVSLEGKRGVVFVSAARDRPQLQVDVSGSLVPVLMPLLARLRHVFDLDADPTVVNAHLAQGALGALVQRRPGIRLIGACDGFEAVLRALLHGRDRSRIVEALGERFDTGVPGLTHLAPGADRVADAGAAGLASHGIPRHRGEAVVAVARRMVEGRLRLEPGADIAAARRGLLEIGGIGDRRATAIVMRALYWPDAFPAADPVLQRAAGASSAEELRIRAERWRPWRAYAALHLWLKENDQLAGTTA
jgi:AraC family transcriptional regulator of adaptative response / DNA-3-methyladenine glycosylase II